MFNSVHPQSTRTDISTPDCAKPIATGVIVHDNNHDRATWHCRLWQYLMRHLLRADEPRIWQKRNAGEVSYRGYNPRSGRSVRCTTETELRAWLDQLPYRRR